MSWALAVRIVAAIVLAYAALAALLFVLLVIGQRSLLYFPDTTRPDMAALLPGRWVMAHTSDGLTLHGWFTPPADDTAPVVLLFHGNAANIGPRADKARDYINTGWGVLLAEYRGYGGNPGLPFEDGLYRDARAYWGALRAEDIDPSRIVLYGESLGSGVATQLANEVNALALVLDVPFASALEIARWRFPLVPFMEVLFQDHYRSDLKIREINMPVLIGVAGQDFIIPERFGRKLYGLADEPKALRYYPNAHHMNIHEHGFSDDVIRFINEVSQ